jgi:predicted phosphodiesterase
LPEDRALAAAVAKKPVIALPATFHGQEIRRPDPGRLMKKLTPLLLLCIIHPLFAVEWAKADTEIALDAPRGRLRLAAVGDLHGVASNELVAALLDQHATDPFDAILLLGDNFETGVSSIDDPLWEGVAGRLGLLGIPLYPLLGNHDYGNPKRRSGGRIAVEGSPSPAAQVEFTEHGWTFPARNYVITSPIAEIVMIDTTPLALDLEEPLLGSSTADEVTRFVSRHLSRQTDRWRIVAGHHNVEQSGTRRFRSRHTRRHMSRLGTMLDDLGTDLYISGHQHHMELYQYGRTIHLISGLAGPRPKKERHVHPPQGSAHFVTTVSRPSVAFAIIDIDAETLRITFHDEADSFTENVFDLARRDTSESEPLSGGLR